MTTALRNRSRRWQPMQPSIIGIGDRVISTDADRITVLFDEYGYRTLALDAVLDNGVLTTR